MSIREQTVRWVMSPKRQKVGLVFQAMIVLGGLGFRYGARLQAQVRENPFTLPPCCQANLNASAALDTWTLKGILGTPTHRFAFFQSAGGEWILREPNDWLGSLRVQAVEETGVFWVTAEGAPGAAESPALPGAWLPLLGTVSTPVSARGESQIGSRVSECIQQPASPMRLSGHLQAVPLSLLIRALHTAGVTVLADQMLLDRPIFLQCTEQAPSEFFSAVCREASMHGREHQGVWQLSVASGTEEPSLETRFITLNYLSVHEVDTLLTSAARSLLSPKGSLLYTKETNSLHLRDLPENLETFIQWLQSIDQAPSQILIEARIVSIRQEDLAEFGLQWGRKATGPADEERADAIQFRAGRGIVQQVQTVLALSTQLLDLSLSALATENKVTLLATPSIVTKNHATASLKQGSEVPYSSRNKKDGGVVFREAMLGLEATPHLLNSGHIQVELKLSYNMPGHAVPMQGEQALAINKQELQTQVILGAGEVLSLGGIFEASDRMHQKGVPWLSRLPVLGRLFCVRHANKNKQLLTLFLSATSVRPQAARREGVG